MAKERDRLALAAQVAQALGDVAGVDAVVLGGSLATGTAHAGSDIDLGIYYDAQGLDCEAAAAVATRLDDAHRTGVFVPPGSWGPWIDGGGWLTVEGVAVDLLLRDAAKVADTIRQCCDGVVTIDYQCGHPFGFVNAIYMGEVACCQPLWAGNDRLAAMKASITPFPEGYRTAAIAKFLWEADFSLLCGGKAAAKQDTLYASGSLFRAAVALAQVVYAHNGLYMLNEKGCLQRLAATPGLMLPPNFVEDIARVMTLLAPDTIPQCFGLLQEQLRRTQQLCGGKP